MGGTIPPRSLSWLSSGVAVASTKSATAADQPRASRRAVNIELTATRIVIVTDKPFVHFVVNINERKAGIRRSIKLANFLGVV